MLWDEILCEKKQISISILRTCEKARLATCLAHAYFSSKRPAGHAYKIKTCAANVLFLANFVNQTKIDLKMFQN